MDRKTREELKQLSKEILGTQNAYKKYIKGVAVDSGEVAQNGRPIKVFKYLTEEQVLEFLRLAKQKLVEDNLADEVQKAAGGSVE